MNGFVMYYKVRANGILLWSLYNTMERDQLRLHIKFILISGT